MTGAERMILLMRQQGNRRTGGLRLAKMETADRCRVGDLLLEREDYLKAEHLELRAGDDVIVFKLDLCTYVILEKVV